MFWEALVTHVYNTSIQMPPPPRIYGPLINLVLFCWRVERYWSHLGDFLIGQRFFSATCDFTRPVGERGAQREGLWNWNLVKFSAFKLILGNISLLELKIAMFSAKFLIWKWKCYALLKKRLQRTDLHFNLSLKNWKVRHEKGFQGLYMHMTPSSFNVTLLPGVRIKVSVISA